MIAATIVLYNPDLSVFARLLASLQGQVDKVIAVDNTGGPNPDIEALLGRSPFPTSYVSLGSNKGVAEAQNVGIRESIAGGYSHVLLLDQDSVPPSNMVEKLIAAESELLREGARVAAVGPKYVDEKTGIPSFAVRYGWWTVRKICLDSQSNASVETDILISSGSIIRTVVLESVGGMSAELFIDLVDTEWALRARRYGYKSYCVPAVSMSHSMGDAAVKAFGKIVYLHNNIRQYYRLRNSLYLLRLPSMTWQWRSYTVRWIPYFFCLSVYVSNGKLRKAQLLARALWDGLLGRLGPAPMDSQMAMTRGE